MSKTCKVIKKEYLKTNQKTLEKQEANCRIVAFLLVCLLAHVGE